MSRTQIKKSRIRNKNVDKTMNSGMRISHASVSGSDISSFAVVGAVILSGALDELAGAVDIK